MGPKDLKEPSCAVCSLPFYLKDPTNPVGTRSPLLLKCAHTACEGCIKLGCRLKEEIKCNICAVVSQASKFFSAEELREEFPVNPFAVGQIALKNSQFAKDKVGVSAIGFYKKKKEIPSDAICCYECKTTLADCSCRQCNCQFCSSCFSRIHSAALVLQKHEKLPLHSSQNIAACEEVVCKEHPGKVFKYYCNECSLYCCKECCFETHLQHSCVEVSVKNKEMLEKFSQAYNEASSVLKQLHMTKKKLETAGDKRTNEEALKVEKQVIQHFSYIHGLLILEQEEILKKIRSVQKQTQSSLSNITNELEANIKEMESILTQSKCSTEENTLDTFPLFPLYKKLQELAKKPCHLILNDEKEFSKFEFTVNETAIKNLKGHCSVVLPFKSEFELRSKFELPEDYVVEDTSDMADPIKKPDISKKLSNQNDSSSSQKTTSGTVVLSPSEIKTKPTSFQDILRKNRQSLAMNKADDTLSTSSTDSFISSICHVPHLTEGSTDIVTICHFVYPSNFYVQRKSCQSELQKLRDHFSRKSNTIRQNQPSSVELGQMYLVQFSRDKKWYRAIVKKAIDDKKFLVFYLDYGNTDEVCLSQLREIPEAYIKIPEQAIHCSLYGCVPFDGQWSESASRHMVSMTVNMELSMFVERVSPSSNSYEVHLRRMNDNSSINDALIFLNCAAATESTDREGGLFKQQLPLHKKASFKQSTVKEKETFDGHISHINTPENFYIQRLDDGGKLIFKLMKELALKYSNIGPNDLLVYNPEPGMAVAAKFTDGKWYRGVIRDIPRPLEVQVQYVDFGNVANISWENIRMLSPIFLRTGVLGLKCSLSDIAPKNPKGWTAASKKAFENMSNIGLTRVYVDEVNEDSLSVVLYQIENNKDICINGLLVKKGYAISNGPSSACPEYSRGSVDKSDADNSSTASLDTKNLTRTLTKTNKYQSSLGKSYEKISSSTFSSTSALDDHSIDENECEDEASRVKIIVMKLASPDEIHIAFETTHNQIFGLITEMTEHYEKTLCTEANKKDWKIHDICAVFRKSDKQWYRGLVTSVNPNSYKVFIKDIVDMVEVESKSLRVLENQFTRLMDGSFKCHLCGILPPGGGVKWPGSTKDYLESLLRDDSDFYIEKMGPSVNDSLPVKLWIKKIKLDGPLAPVREEWNDVSSMLVDCGLALPDRLSEYYTGVQRNIEDSTSASEPGFAGAKLVSQWLQSSYKDASVSANVFDGELVSSNEENKYIRSNQSSCDHLREIRRDVNKALDWLPAEPFKQQDFIGLATYVDMDCAIFIQDKEHSKETLSLLQKSLLHLFQGSYPKPHDLTWSNGQICIAYYDCDKNWYRGKVVEVKPDCIEVLFVDYGNTESLQPDQLRKQICMADIPIQCQRCLTTGIIPVSKNGKWSIQVLDYVHGITVDKECRVSLKSPTTKCNDYVILDLILPCGQSLFNVLLDMHYATYVIDCNKVGNKEEEELIPKSQSPRSFEKKQHFVNQNPFKCEEVDHSFTETDFLVQHQHKNPNWLTAVEMQEAPQVKLNNMCFKKLFIPESLVELDVEVTGILNSTSVMVNIIKCEDTEITSIKSNFDLLHRTIQEQAQEMPHLCTPVLDSPCLGCFTDDDVWYRALVKEVFLHENLVLVVYVDFGNAEKLPLERLREIKEEWLEIPKQAIETTLYEITRGPNHDDESAEKLFKCLDSPPYTMTIDVHQPRLQAEFFNSDGELAYQSLLDSGVLSKV